MFKKLIAIIAIVVASPFVLAGGALSDNDILSAAMKAYDKRQKENTKEFIGIHDGKKVIAIYPCGDICPDYTKRVIHYAINIDDCEENGGVIKQVRVTRGRSSNKESFCVPKVLAQNWSKIVF